MRTVGLVGCLLLSGAASACGGQGATPPIGTGGTTTGTPPDLSHLFPMLDVAPAEEVNGLCQSWTVGNESPIDVNRIVATNLGGVHHSNWIWVPDTQYPGPDGTWTCADRGFDQILAGGVGGVFFAQSTQSLTDTQAFPEGVAFEMPAHVRIIGDIHLLNPTPDALQTQVHFDVFTLEPGQVTVPVQPMAFTNLALDIAPLTKTEAHMQCATQADFDVYYVLPHYHALGTAMTITVAGGTADGASVFSASPGYGEPWGQSYDPPFAVRGAAGLGISCFYDNGRSATGGYGTGDQEMCVTLIYTSGRKGGGQANLNLTTTDLAGLHRTDALCLSI